MVALGRRLSGILAAGALAGCGQSSNSITTINPSATNCPANSASILVGDGFLMNLCGCAGEGESNGTTFPAPGNLTCHLSSTPSTVVFYYLGTVLKHQIVPSGTATFVASPVSDPNSAYPIRVYAVTLNQPATKYSFIDTYSGMVGQIFAP